MPKYSFTVGNKTDDASVEGFLQGLGRLIEVGELAKKSLDVINSQGFCDEAVPYLKGCLLDYVRLPKRVKPDESCVPDLTSFEVQVGEPYGDTYCGHKVTVIAVFWTGRGLVPISRDSYELKFETVRRAIGDIRIGKRGMSFELNTTKPISIQIKEKVLGNPDSEYFYSKMRNLLTKAAIQADGYYEIPAEIIDIRKEFTDRIKNSDICKKIIIQAGNLAQCAAVIDT